MGAGDSAATEAARHLLRADAHEAEAARARADAANYTVAASAERRVARKLSSLSAAGFFLLPDRGWPGSRRAQVDLVIVGPSGVFIVDSKAWKELEVVEDRVFRGDADVTEDLEALASLRQHVEGDLAEIGLAPNEVHAIAAFPRMRKQHIRHGELDLVREDQLLDHLTRRGTRLTLAQVDEVLIRCLALFPQVGAPAPVVATISEPVLPRPNGEIDIADFPTDEEIENALRQATLAAPIEEWMAFLDPEQAKTVRRTFSGPSRIRGAAGTGKTVVGLHRAAYLARATSGTILVATFIRTLPRVLETIFARLAPDEANRVQFVNIHSWAKQLLRERGVEHTLDPTAMDQAFNAAWVKVGRHGALERSVRNRDYWRDEIDYVIKGRGLTDFAPYADLVRTGRRYRLNLDQRRAVWDLYEAYETELRSRDVIDWADLILLAKAELEREPLDRYAAVIVDEAQDLTAVQVQMLHALVGDREDGLTLIGDGQQSIYPGGYTLAEVGISVTGRAIVMDVNYRNTKEILAYAATIAARSEFADFDGLGELADTPRAISRTGVKPIVVSCRSKSDAENRARDRVTALVGEHGVSPGDIGVLCETKWVAVSMEVSLRAAGHSTVSLEDYDGSIADAVKVGTVKRAKGLEFKHVIIPDARQELISGAAPEDDGERERWELAQREQYVAVTRARDGLWVGVVQGN